MTERTAFVFRRALAVLALACLACGRDEPAPAPPAAGRVAEVVEAADVPRVVVLGDSLAAGLGLAEEEAFPARLEEMLRAEGMAVEVVNAGVSGDTTAGALARLDWLLRQEPDVLVVELGGNDGLRGLSLEATEENLRRILRRGRETGARLLLAGMRIPTNYGPDYTERFAEIYPRLAAEMGVPLVPFLLEGVGGVEELNLPDGLHPNAEGQRRVAENVLPHLRPLLEEAEEAPAGRGAAQEAGP